jgi:hypothetical protein
LFGERDRLGVDTTVRFDTEIKRVDVDEAFLGASLAGEDTSLDCDTVRSSLVGVDALRRFLDAEKSLDAPSDLGITSGSTEGTDLEAISASG